MGRSRQSDDSIVNVYAAFKKRRLMNAPKQHDTCSIFPVPSQIREYKVEAYTPKYVSIGPYHHPSVSPDRERTLNPMQQHKRRCVRFLIARCVCVINYYDIPSEAWVSEMDKLEDLCLTKLRGLEKRARDCYFAPIPIGSAEFVEMMLMDACFLLYVLMKSHIERDVALSSRADLLVELDFENKKAHNSRNDFYLSGRWHEQVVKLGSRLKGQDSELFGIRLVWNWVTYDLLMLENQIPSFIVEQVFNILEPPLGERTLRLSKCAFDFLHLLHPRPGSRAFPEVTTNHDIPFDCFHHLLHYYHQILLPREAHVEIEMSKQEHLHGRDLTEWIPSATELEEVGVRFEVGNSKSILDISFSEGKLTIPPLHIYNYSIVLFRNLLALEQCSPVQPYITFYILFMSCLLRSGEDVRLLHLKGIIMNLTSTEEEVSVCFRRLCHGLHYPYEHNYLNALFVDVRNYHQSKWHKWRATLFHNYFGNPWLVVSLLAAFLLLILTIEQAVFAALSYFKPPK